MADQTKAQQIKDRIQEALKELGRSLEQLLNPQKPQSRTVPIPVPVDRRPRRQIRY